MDNANGMDTSQPANPNDTSGAFEPAPVESSENQVSIDDIILGSVEDSASAFGTPEPEQPQVAETPAQPVAPVAPTTDARNDERRFEYWQSRASKLENEVDSMKAQQQPAPAAVQPEAPVKEEFPPPPTRPEKPRNFSREEAYSDSQSESARYLDDIDEWRDNSDEYNQLKHQYDLAVMQEKLDKETNVRMQSQRAREAQIQQSRQVQEISQHVQSQYNMGAEETQKFVKQMSSPDSLTMDNLVQLWRFQQGQNAPTGQVPSAPSPAFEQTQRAQQVPQPMGVLPGSSTAAQGSTEDQIMDSMIGDFKNKNPWNK